MASVLGMKLSGNQEASLFWTSQTVHYKSQVRNLSLPCLAAIQSVDLSHDGKRVLVACTKDSSRLSTLIVFQINETVQETSYTFKADSSKNQRSFISAHLLPHGNACALLYEHPSGKNRHELVCYSIDPFNGRGSLHVSDPYVCGRSVLYTNRDLEFTELLLSDLSNPSQTITFFSESEEEKIKTYTLSDDAHKLALMTSLALYIWEKPGREVARLTDLKIDPYTPFLSLSPRGNHLIFLDETQMTTIVDVQTKTQSSLRKIPIQNLKIASNEQYAVWSDEKTLSICRLDDLSTRHVTFDKKIDDVIFAANQTLLVNCQSNLYSTPLIKLPKDN